MENYCKKDDMINNNQLIICIQKYIIKCQRIMPPNFNKGKENRILDVKKRFHFDPKSQDNRSRAGAKQKSVEMIIKDENDQFSSVKQQNDFNDSSWLARLVNGLEEYQNFGLPELTNLMSVASSQINKKLENLEQNTQSQIKGSEEKQKLVVRKSGPTMPNCRCQKRSKDYHKLNCQTQHLIEIPNKNEKEKHIKSMSDDPKKIAIGNAKNYNNRKYSLSNQKQLYRKLHTQNEHKRQVYKQVGESQYTKQEKQQKQDKQSEKEQKKQQIHCKSIKQKQNETPIKKKRKQKEQAIIIDLDDISLKSQEIAVSTTPSQNKNKEKIKDEIQKTKFKEKIFSNLNKENKNKSNKIKIDKLSQNLKEKNNINDKQNDQQNFNNLDNSDIIQQHDQFKLISPITNINYNANVNDVLVFSKGYKIKTNNQKHSKMDEQIRVQQQNQENNQIQILSSHNQFLDTFKQQIPLVVQYSLSQALTSQNITSVQQNLIKSPVNMSHTSQSTSKIGSIKKNNFTRFQDKTQQSDKYEKISNKQGVNLTGNEENQIPTFNDKPTQAQAEIAKSSIISDRIFERQNSLNKVNGGGLKSFQCIRKNSYLEPKNSISGTMKKSIENQVQQIKLQPIRLNLQYSSELKQSPKFNYCLPLSISNQQSLTQFSCSSQKLTKRLAYQQIYSKLNASNEPKIHKYNCNENLLNVQEKYEIGALLSKIKYLDYTYNERQFLNECLKMENTQKQENKNENDTLKWSMQKSNKSNESKQINSVSRICPNQGRRFWQNDNEVLLKGKTMSETKHQKFKAFNLEKSVGDEKQKMNEKYLHNLSQIQYDQEFIPLFPETLSVCSERFQPQFKAHTSCVEATKIKQTGDIGSIIDSLNSKLSNYIQTNNLEDTYRKFKLEFVQLKRNMLY